MDRRRERERARVSSLLCDRGWTEHLHHLIYDPLRCTDNKREKAPRCLACRRSRRARAHSQNKFAYGCNGCSWGKRETKGEEADRWNTDAPSSSSSSPPLEIELVVAFSSSGWGRGGEGKEGGGENDLDVPRIGHWRRDNAVFVSTGCDCSRRDTERTVECGMIR